MLNFIKKLFRPKKIYKIDDKEVKAIAELLETAFQSIIDDYNPSIKIEVKAAKVRDTFGFLIEVTDKEPKQEVCH